jgi:hypothetical protein
VHPSLYEDLEPHKGQSHVRSPTTHKLSWTSAPVLRMACCLQHVGALFGLNAHDSDVNVCTFKRFFDVFLAITNEFY